MGKKGSRAFLQAVKKAADLSLKKQTQEGFAKIFTKLGYKGIAAEVKAGRNVVGNVEYSIRRIHDRLGPRVNVSTLHFTPQSKNAKKA